MTPERLDRKLEELGISKALLEERGLHIYEEAERLEVVQTDADGREHALTPEAARAWLAMQRAATVDGIQLFVISAYRSVDRQVRIIERKLDAGRSIDAILRENAPPGCSEHHTGRALDIGTSGEPLLETSFAETPAHAWLQQHAGEYGFSLSFPKGNAAGYQYEPWHWCYHGST